MLTLVLGVGVFSLLPIKFSVDLAYLLCCKLEICQCIWFSPPNIFGSAQKTDPVQFKCGFGEGLLKDKFAFF